MPWGTLRPGTWPFLAVPPACDVERHWCRAQTKVSKLNKKTTFWTKQMILWLNDFNFVSYISNWLPHCYRNVCLLLFFLYIGWYNTWCEPREPRRILNGEPGNDSDAYIPIHPILCNENKENTNFRKWFINLFRMENDMDVLVSICIGVCGKNILFIYFIQYVYTIYHQWLLGSLKAKLWLIYFVLTNYEKYLFDLRNIK